jgi:mRNA-degrading endonuclease RelE of RelBE toxin-antitoxin system
MPKPKRQSKQGAARSSAAPSRKPYKVYLAEDLRKELRGWPKPERARVGKLIQRAQDNFGTPHLHSGLGIRDLSPKGSRLNVYECRMGAALRLIFTVERPAVLYFHMIGNHDEVRRFLRSLL